jgi:long-subunit acyl-CoA synthetase (AMP-forming)
MQHLSVARVGVPSTSVVDEWFSTGDICRVDEDGYIFLIARKSI